MDIFVGSVIRLTNGLDFAVHNHPSREHVHISLSVNISDLPSFRKVNGLQGHTSKTYVCYQCPVKSFMLALPAGFNIEELEPRDDWRHLKYSFRARHADETQANEIKLRRGVLWTPLNLIPGWMPGKSGVIDFMHCIFLGLIKHVSKILTTYGLLNARRRQNPQARFEAFLKSLKWPVEATRLPPSIARGKGSPKADQWRNLIAVLFVGLFVAWEKDGEIPDALYDTDAHPPQHRLKEIKRAMPNRNLQDHYEVILQFSAAVRILATRSISPVDVQRGCAALARSIQTWARMHIHLTPYFHHALHIEEQIYKYGPIYGLWTFPYEQNNGRLSRFRHNQHKGGELEGTLMRRWWAITFNHELVYCHVFTSCSVVDMICS
ncbi:hypothetical protein CONPUDRAFT_62915 [Coniophora puteana RWD-64-598 SS2]|uniref:DUF4218 domain-containing protein n=1 Tax=Coniophora puteana (strain RWD-64-598) TaxID=741705 RepID=A0A5M3MEW5_CONPW|nr:uncharacterized protein CONPUDRAFT_62915 [Coniophora puteana RWD-64-598 SS2]EIW77460.1 hypothetical protein CONPUDRAFT_62915 [Coniophora puteana RWD-64-598 SS2]